MAKLPRITQKIFGKNAPENQITTFGSIKAGAPVYTQSPSQIMNANFEEGWSAAVEDDYAPYRQDRNAVDTALTQQLAYLFQEGIPEWDSGTTYYKGSVVKVVNGNALSFYKSIADNNTSSVNTTNRWHKMLEINASNQIVSPSINSPTISGGSMSNGTFANPTFSGNVNVPLASQSSSTDSTIAASIGWVNNPSLSSNVVHKTGNETIGGDKTFTGLVVNAKNNPYLILQNTSLTKGTIPDSTKGTVLVFNPNTDSSNTADCMARVQSQTLANGDVNISILAHRNIAGDTTSASITVTNKLDGTKIATAPAPTEDTTSSIQIDTVGARNTKLADYALDNAVMKLTGDQTAAGGKTFTGILYEKRGGTYSASPSSQQTYAQILGEDSTDKKTMMIDNYTATNGATHTRLIAYLPSDNTKHSRLDCVVLANGTAYATCPTPTEDTTSSSQIDTVGARNTKLSSYALDTNVVHNTGNEEIGGIKTFTDNIDLKKSNPQILLQNSNITKGTTPSSNVYTTLSIGGTDVPNQDSMSLGRVMHGLMSNGESQLRLRAYKNEANSSDSAEIAIHITLTGEKYATCPTPDASANSTQITTAAWVNSRISSVMTTSGAGLATFDKSPSGYIKFANGIIMQWGVITSTSFTGRLATITFNTPFSSADSYGVVGCNTWGGSSDHGWGHIYNCTATKFDFSTAGDMQPTRWIAIGY